MSKIGVARFSGVMLVAVLLFSGVVEAAVTLNGYADNNNKYEYVLFGRYPQVSTDIEPNGEYVTEHGVYYSVDPIIWRVLSADASEALLLSENLLECVRFGETTTWSTSNLCKWLNSRDAGFLSGHVDSINGFLHLENFTNEEYFAIKESSIETRDEKNTLKETTTHRMFALSYQEMQEAAGYGFTNAVRQADLTDYAVSHRASTGTGEYVGKGRYWLRSPLASNSGFIGYMWFANVDGVLYGMSINDSSVANRPACFLNLESFIFKSALSSVSSDVTGEAGRISNPYLLMLSTGNQYPNGTGWVDLPNFTSKDKKPDTRTITGDTMVISWDRTISPALALWPDSRDFTLTRADNSTMHPDTVVSDDADKTKLILTFPQPVNHNEVVTLDYNLNTDAISFDSTATSHSADVVASFTDEPVTNLTPGAPSFTASPDITPDALVGTPYNQTFTFEAAGIPEPTLSMGVVTPADAYGLRVRFAPGNGGKGELTITGTPASTGTVSATITASNAIDPDAKHTWTLTVTLPPAVPVIGVTLDKTALLLIVGGKSQLTATVAPMSATNKAVSWSTSDLNVATVDASGNVTAVGPGSCTITVKTADGGKTATCRVTVTKTEIVLNLDDLGLENGVLKLGPGEELDVTVTGTPEGLRFKATGLPDGLSLTEEGRLTGRVPQVGEYLVTLIVTAPDGTQKEFRFTVDVTEKGVKGRSSGGGCDAGLGAPVLAAAVALRRRRGGA